MDKTLEPTLKQFFTQSGEDLILTLSDNSLGVHQRCDRAGQYYICERRKANRSTSALSFGGAFHKAQEIRVTVKDPVQRDTLTQQVLAEHFEKNPVDPDEYRTLDLLLDVVRAYNKTYTPDLVKTVLRPDGTPMTEIKFNLPLGKLEVNSDVYIGRDQTLPCRTLFVEFSGRIDDIVELDGQYWVRDYKTTSIGGDGFLAEFKTSSQPLGYVWAATQLCPLPIAGFLLDAAIVRKPTRTGKGIEFVRQRYPYHPSRIPEWAENTLALVSGFVSNCTSNSFPMRTRSCIGKYGKCDYFDVCTLPLQLRSQFLFGADFTDCHEKTADE